MAYNRENILTRIVEIQDITLEHTNRGVMKKWVFDNVIFPRYHISYATFNGYMSLSGTRTELSKLKEKRTAREKAKKLQGVLFC